MDINFVKKALLIEVKIYIDSILNDVISTCEDTSDKQDRLHDYLRDATEWVVSVSATTSANDLLAFIHNSQSFYIFLTDVAEQASERQTLIKTVLVFTKSPFDTTSIAPVRVIE